MDTNTLMDIATAGLERFQRQINAETVREQAEHIRKLETVLRQIVHEYQNTYDADCDFNGCWTAAASIPVEVMERAKRLCK